MWFGGIRQHNNRNIFELGRPLGYNLLMTFDGLQYLFFGNFTALRSEVVLWRIRVLQQIIAARLGSIPERIKMGVAEPNATQMALIKSFMDKLAVWILVTGDVEKTTIQSSIASTDLKWPVKVFAISDIAAALQNIA